MSPSHTPALRSALMPRPPRSAPSSPGAHHGVTPASLVNDTNVVWRLPSRYPMARADSEQCTANPYMCRAVADRRLEVLAHPGRDHICCRVSDSYATRQVGESAERHVGLPTQRCDGHDST